MDKHNRYQITEPNELLAWMLVQFSTKGRNTIKSLLVRKQVSVDGVIVTKHNHPLTPGQVVTIQWTGTIEEIKPVGLKIIFEDTDLIVIDKEAGLLSIASTEEKEFTAQNQLNEHVRRTDAKSRVYIVHRLDRDTSGIMMFAKSEKVKELLQNNWHEAVSERIYIAVVEGQVRRKEHTIISWLTEGKTLRMYSSPTPNAGQKAITHYKVIQSNKQYSMLEIQLETGRKNQIRVHMQDIGHPVVGDKKYGSTKNTLGRLGLHASVLAFTHPIHNLPMRFESRVPEKFTRIFTVQG